MLVTFHSRAYADITLFGDVAQALLKMMGHSGAVPGAVLAADIPAARACLLEALAARDAAPPLDPGDEDGQDEEEKEPPTPLSLRALPLLNLLDASAQAGCDVMWD